MTIKKTVVLKNIENRISKLKHIDKVLFIVGNRLNLLIQHNWDKQIGADGNKMPKLSIDYKSEKEQSGRNGIRNLSYTGLMRLGLTLFKMSKERLRLGFVNNQIEKARSNYKKANNMMRPVSDDINHKLQKIAFKEWQKL